MQNEVIKKYKSSTLILINNKKEFLFILRDNNSNILFPGCFDLVGGVIENEETPLDAIKRESSEEIGFVPKNLSKFMTLDTPFHVEHVYWSVFNDDINSLSCYEGQGIYLISLNEFKSRKFAFNHDKTCLLFLSHFEEHFLLSQYREGDN